LIAIGYSEMDAKKYIGQCLIAEIFDCEC